MHKNRLINLLKSKTDPEYIVYYSGYFQLQVIFSYFGSKSAKFSLCPEINFVVYGVGYMPGCIPCFRHAEDKLDKPVILFPRQFCAIAPTAFFCT